jgi:hypothetical protein
VLTAMHGGGRAACSVRLSLGDATTEDHIAKPVESGSYHDCAWLADGSAVGWSLNNAGQLGDATSTSSATPVLGLP